MQPRLRLTKDQRAEQEVLEAEIHSCRKVMVRLCALRRIAFGKSTFCYCQCSAQSFCKRAPATGTQEETVDEAEKSAAGAELATKEKGLQALLKQFEVS